jgi:hypothetical protein
MVKRVLFLIVVTATITIDAKTATNELKRNCINCHIEQKIPSELIYRRYLQKYSTHNSIRKKLFSYLKNPNKKSSIMPKQFFLKFPEKKALDMNETHLKESIDAYLNYFDIKNRLILPSSLKNLELVLYLQLVTNSEERAIKKKF